MRRLNESGQMLVLETIFFASTILLSIVFLYQLSPSSVISEEYTSDLKSIGDDALRNLYSNEIIEQHSIGYPSNKLVHYIIADDYGSFISDIQKLIPSTVLYNVYITNGDKSVFWCNSFGRNDSSIDILPAVDPVVIAHCIIPIDSNFITSSSSLYSTFEKNSNCIYEVRLHMWYI